MTSLTDRYVHAVTSQLPEGQRDDIAQELRATIADVVEARAVGLGPEQAEREALLELGHPSALADGYRGRGRALIGPTVYPAWLALLKMLLAIVPAVVGLVVLVVALAQGQGGVEAFAAGLGGAVEAALQVFFWVTVAFAIVERSDVAADTFAPLVPSKDWTPESLPELDDAKIGVGEIATSLISAAVGIVLLTMMRPTVDVDGRTLQLFTDNAMLWRWVAVAGLALGVVVVAYVVVRRRWTVPAAHLNLLSNLAFGIPVVWLLLTDDLVHPDTVDLLFQGEAIRWADLNLTVFALVLAAILLWDTLDAYRRAARARTSRPTA